jgi:MFS family permease
MTSALWRQEPLFVLATLTLVNTINWADRQVVPILVPSIKTELALSDTEIGIISGVAFSIVYAVAAFVFGFLADRRSRRNVILFGLVCWSAATAASGLATDFWSLFFARFFTGLGEASLYPCALSLLTDAFVIERRGRAIGILGASTALGGGLGIGLGGWLVKEIGWRNVFFTYGGFGLLLVPLLLMLREPPRLSAGTTVAHDPPLQVVGEALRDVRLLAIWSSGALMIGAATGWITWAPSYFERDLGFDVGEIGLVFGIAQLFGGVAGSILGGALGDRWRKKRFGGQLTVSAVAGLVTAPLVGVALIEVPHAVLLAAAVLGPFAIFAAFPNLQTMVAEIVPARRLGLTFAVHVLFLSGIGAALGPFVVGFVSDRTGSLRMALVFPLIAAVVSAALAWFAERVVRARTPEALR